jgi:hypothetical protein
MKMAVEAYTPSGLLVGRFETPTEARRHGYKSELIRRAIKTEKPYRDLRWCDVRQHDNGGGGPVAEFIREHFQADKFGHVAVAEAFEAFGATSRVEFEAEVERTFRVVWLNGEPHIRGRVSYCRPTTKGANITNRNSSFQILFTAKSY